MHLPVRVARWAGVSQAAVRQAVLLSFTAVGFPHAVSKLSWAKEILRKE